MTEKVKVCITPECGKESAWKGLCRSCYGQARHLIDKKETTWEELADMDLCIPDPKPFTAVFRKKKAEKSSSINPALLRREMPIVPRDDVIEENRHE